MEKVLISDVNFGVAFNGAMHGRNIQRVGWNGAGLKVKVTKVIVNRVEKDAVVIVYPNGDNFLWTPSPTDLVAKDWIVYGDEL